jgi:hypothetical protein
MIEVKEGGAGINMHCTVRPIEVTATTVHLLLNM